uniref:Uncharacterized protein n=1 Tax=Lepeophtheirus salmonis TaxID=72036 RepID=A0A0K2VLX7_LEPSM
MCESSYLDPLKFRQILIASRSRTLVHHDEFSNNSSCPTRNSKKKSAKRVNNSRHSFLNSLPKDNLSKVKRITFCGQIYDATLWNMLMINMITDERIGLATNHDVRYIC